MKKYIKLISTLLAVLMMLSSMTVLFTLETFAAEETTGKETTSTETGSETESETEAETGSNNSGNNNNNNDKNTRNKTYYCST